MTQLAPEELEDIRADYATSLLDLTFNSKPIINMLTTIAQENLSAAVPIVKAIEDRIASAPPNQKLPSIYLLDSICKNVGSPFTPVFSRNLYKTFMDCYTAVDNTTRNKLSDLFKTWKIPVTGSHSLVPVFPAEVTRKIEDALLRMRAIQDRSNYGPPAPYGAGWQQSRPPIVDQLLHDIDGLLMTLDTRVRINPDDYQSRDLMGKLTQLHSILRTSSLLPHQLDVIRDQLRGITSLCAAPPVSRFTPAQTQPMDLLTQLAMAGMITGSPFPLQSRPLVDLKSAAFLVDRPDLVDLLYDAMPLQCFQCGQRWHDTPQERTLKDQHLDSHFTTNKRLRELSVRAQSRALYLAETDWISFTIEGTTIQASKAEAVTVEIISSVPKPSDPALQDAVCPICKEAFVTDWDDSTEEWMWKNAVDVGGTIYHTNCHAEASAAHRRSEIKNTMKEETIEESDEDIVLPMNGQSEVKEEEADLPPFVLADALKSLSSTLSGMNGLKRKASEELDDTRVKLEVGVDTNGL